MMRLWSVNSFWLGKAVLKWYFDASRSEVHRIGFQYHAAKAYDLMHITITDEWLLLGVCTGIKKIIKDV